MHRVNVFTIVTLGLAAWLLMPPPTQGATVSGAKYDLLVIIEGLPPSRSVHQFVALTPVDQGTILGRYGTTETPGTYVEVNLGMWSVVVGGFQSGVGSNRFGQILYGVSFPSTKDYWFAYASFFVSTPASGTVVLDEISLGPRIAD